MENTAAMVVAQAMGRRYGELRRNATRVRICATVTALPLQRAGIALGCSEKKVAANATVATMSRNSTPAISHGSRAPENATTPTAAAMNILSAIGSSTSPYGELP